MLSYTQPCFFDPSFGVHEPLICSYGWCDGHLMGESLTFALVELSCNLVSFEIDFDLLPCLGFIKRGFMWLELDH